MLLNTFSRNKRRKIEKNKMAVSKCPCFTLSNVMFRCQNLIGSVMFSGKQTTARKMADQLKNCINQRAHGFYSNRIHTAGWVWITDTITNVMTHYNRFLASTHGTNTSNLIGHCNINTNTPSHKATKLQRYISSDHWHICCYFKIAQKRVNVFTDCCACESSYIVSIKEGISKR